MQGHSFVSINILFVVQNYEKLNSPSLSFLLRHNYWLKNVRFHNTIAIP